jgi:hypothetical protein
MNSISAPNLQCVREGRLSWAQLSEKERLQVLGAVDGVRLDAVGQEAKEQADELAQAWVWQVGLLSGGVTSVMGSVPSAGFHMFHVQSAGNQLSRPCGPAHSSGGPERCC